WFTIAALYGRPINVYGDGKQVRDILFVDDLCALYDACIQNIDQVRGKAFNVGGGPKNRLSLRELLKDLERRVGRDLKPTMAPVRPGDQPVFVADVRKLKAELGWEPATDAAAGLAILFDWVKANPELFRA